MIKGKTYCPTCKGVTHIQKGLNTNDYKGIVILMTFAILMLIVEVAHLYVTK